jgi:predicted GIY-YIG superfamily endonuclease
MVPKRVVYVIQSDRGTKQHYVGLTSNVTNWLAAHNAGASPHTHKYCPWRLMVTVEFASEERAVAFEKYLTSGSGSAFLKRHLL